MRKKSASAIDLALCAAMAVPTMAAVKFADENDVPWETAKVYISQAAEMGLMVGQQNNDGTSLFRAKDKVTYFETIQLSYNMLREAAKAVPSYNVTDKWKTVMAGYKVPAWAYEATAYCLENKIVLVNELQGFVGADGKRGNATREDVAVIFGRTLSAVYDTDSNAKLEFNDKDKISKDAAEFVALLYNKGILLGDNNSNFNPANYINRAEMAVIVTKTYNVLNGKSADDGIETFAGTVSSVSDGNKNFSINVSDGKSSKEFSGDRDTPASMDSESYSFLDIEKGDKVTVVYKDKEVLLAVVEKAKPEKAAAGDVSGMINNILSDRVVLEGSSGGTDVYNFASPVLLTLNGKPSTYKEIFKAVENGAEIKAVVTINSAGLAEEVAAKGNADEVNGTVSDMDKNAFVIKRNGGDEEYYYCAGSCYISFEGEKINIAE